MISYPVALHRGRLVWSAVLLLAGSFISNSAHAAGGDKFLQYGLLFGVQGGYVNRFPDSPDDTKATGQIGVEGGYQLGAQLKLGHLEARALYDVKRVISENIRDQLYGTGQAYTDTLLTVPVMWTKKIKSVTGGAGLFYSHPLDAESETDGGIVVSSSVSGEKIPFMADFTCFAGLFLQQSEGNNFRCMASIGIRLR